MTAGRGESLPDLYEVLRVDRAATREEIVRAWRQRARAEHPDSQPHDHAAPARFRALAEAYRVLSDPARRAAYDRATGPGPGSGAAAPGGPSGQERAPRRAGHAGEARATPAGRPPGAPLWAGPVRVEPPSSGPAAAGPDDDDADPAELLLRYLAARWRRPW